MISYSISTPDMSFHYNGPIVPLQYETLQENKCTYPSTGTTLKKQFWAPCLDCFTRGADGSFHEGACIACLHNCHMEHNIGEIRYGPFFCDCAHKKMCPSFFPLVPMSTPMPTSKPDDDTPILVPKHITTLGSDPSNPRVRVIDDPIYSNTDDQPVESCGCTFAKSGRNYMHQPWAICYDCFDPMGNEGACAVCLKTCHNGHRIGPMKYGNFFCDCGAKGMCKRLSLMGTVQEFSKCSNNVESKLFSSMGDSPVFSPPSITYILSLAHHGAMKNTEQEFTSLMGTKLSEQQLYNIAKIFTSDVTKFKNIIAINPKKLVNTRYVELIARSESTSLISCSDRFATINSINAEVNNATKGLIQSIVSPSDITEDTVMALANVLYFDAAWQNPFDIARTSQMRKQYAYV